MLFCKALKTTSTVIDTYNKPKNYLDEAQISMKNITSCATDGAPVMMDKKHGCLILKKNANPEILLVQLCFSQRKFSVQKTFTCSK
jgi:hypothetical protein